MKRIFNGVVFTNHALERLEERGIKQGDAWATLNNPGSSRRAQRKGSWVFYRSYGNRMVEVVASKNDRGEWVVLSVWDKLIPDWKKTRGSMNDPIWKKVLKEIGRIFFG